jgi:hypothetical protein
MSPERQDTINFDSHFEMDGSASTFAGYRHPNQVLVIPNVDELASDLRTFVETLRDTVAEQRPLEDIYLYARAFNFAVVHLEAEFATKEAPSSGIAGGLFRAVSSEAADTAEEYRTLERQIQELRQLSQTLDQTVEQAIHQTSITENPGYERVAIVYSQLVEANTQCNRLIATLSSKPDETIRFALDPGLAGDLKRFYKKWHGYTGGKGELPLHTSGLKIWNILELATTSISRSAVMGDLEGFKRNLQEDLGLAQTILANRQTEVRDALYEQHVDKSQINKLLRTPVDMRTLPMDSRWGLFKANTGDTINLVVDTTTGTVANVVATIGGTVDMAGEAAAALPGELLDKGSEALRTGREAVTDHLRRFRARLGGQSEE